MGFQYVQLTLPTDFGPDELRAAAARKLRLHDPDFTVTIERQSLDARSKRNVHWLVRAGVTSPECRGAPPEPAPAISIPKLCKPLRAVVVGSGPAGFFAARVLQEAGAHVAVFERGMAVPRRAEALTAFERGGAFAESANYAFGEGGAGTFSDGKLTSRTKTIGAERRYVLAAYVAAGAPEEILCLAHPHLGSDNLRRIVPRLRENFRAAGGTIRFETTVRELHREGERIAGIRTDTEEVEADLVVVACGHSAFDTHRMLMPAGVRFHPKPFALGMRAEHLQERINRAQWGCASLPGVKAAEYRLTHRGKTGACYTFCMCPGGMVVPAGAWPGRSIVNGMSAYQRAGRFANAAVVAAMDPRELLGEAASPEAVLDWLDALEQRPFELGGYRAPAVTIRDFLAGRLSKQLPRTSYPLGVYPANPAELLPGVVLARMRDGLQIFARKLRGYEEGLLLGIETKTSAPLQAERDGHGPVCGFRNLYVTGEGSGRAGGIVSSAADGVKTALHALETLR